MPESKYSIYGIKNGIPFFFFRGESMNYNQPISLDEQVKLMEKYGSFQVVG